MGEPTMSERPRVPRGREGERGFSMLQTLIALGVVVILAAVAVTNFASVKRRVILNNAALEVTRYLEKTRTDSIKRHAASTSQSGLQVTSSTTYTVTMDFNNDSNIDASETRTLTLPSEVTFNVTPSAPAAVSYDWRGRLASSNRITLMNTAGSQINIDLSGGGDISLNSNFTLPTITATPYPTPAAASSVTATPTPSPSPSPPMPSGAPECYMTTDVTDVTIRKNGLTTGYVAVTQDQYGKPGTITLTYDSSQLGVTPNNPTIDSEGTITLAINDIKNGSKTYTTTLTIDHPCGQKIINITVTQ